MKCRYCRIAGLRFSIGWAIEMDYTAPASFHNRIGPSHRRIRLTRYYRQDILLADGRIVVGRSKWTLQKSPAKWRPCRQKRRNKSLTLWCLSRLGISLPQRPEGQDEGSLKSRLLACGEIVRTCRIARRGCGSYVNASGSIASEYSDHRRYRHPDLRYL